MRKPNKTTHTDCRIPCPHCGHQWTNPWDYAWADYEEDELKTVECRACEKKFTLRRVVSVTYTKVPK